jgi:hypothetical protein
VSKNGKGNGYSKQGGQAMPTACVLYDGKRFEEFQIVGLTIDPNIVAAVVRLMQQIDPGALVKAAAPRSRKRRSQQPALVEVVNEE